VVAVVAGDAAKEVGVASGYVVGQAKDQTVSVVERVLLVVECVA